MRALAALAAATFAPLRPAAAQRVGPALNVTAVPIGPDGGLAAGRGSLARPAGSAITAAIGSPLAR